MWGRNPKSHRLVRSFTMAIVNPNGNDDHEEQGNEHDVVVNVAPKTLRDKLMPTRSCPASCLVMPTNSQTFHIKPEVIQLLPLFYGLERENPL